MALHVLTALEKSDTAEDIFQYAMDQFPHANHTVLHVLDPPAAGYRTGDEAGADHPDSEFNQTVAAEIAFLDPLKAKAEANDIAVTKDFAIADARGKEARAICHYADENEADLIVVGSNEKNRLSRVVLGSVAEAVVRHASQSVLVVRQP